MVTKQGGYAIVSYDDKDIYSKVQSAYTNQKPILFYDDTNTCYFIDTIKKNNDGDYELTKGGRTFTITDVNSVIAEGNIQEKLHLYQILIRGNISDDIISFLMNIYSTKELKEGQLTIDDTDLINELNLYQETFMRDNESHIQTIATYENLYVDTNNLEFNFYDDNGETSFDNGTTSVTISKIF